MKDILFLVHRIPFPPNKGDKIRSFHILKALSQNYNVHLGTFIDQKEDLKYVDEVSKFCRTYKFIKLNRLLSYLQAMLSIFYATSISIAYFKSFRLQKWVNNIVLTNNINSVLVFSSSMAQYVEHCPNTIDNCYIDFVDVDSQKWKQYSLQKKNISRLIFKWEYKLLEKYERKIAEKFKKSIFVTEKEKNIFVKNNKDLEKKIYFVNNGVNEHFFSIDEGLKNPYAENEKIIVFTGAMDYMANVDAVVWFVEDILPKIENSISDLKFYIVGSNPTTEVKKLASNNNVHVTGYIDDIRVYIYHATVVVAPLRVARGVQNKVLEAMALSKPIVATQDAIEGIKWPVNLSEFVVNNAKDFAKQTIKVLKQENNKQYKDEFKSTILKYYQWSNNLKKYLKIIND